MIRVAVAGAAGRMGSMIVRLVEETDGIELAGAVESEGHPFIGRDAGEIAGTGSIGINITGKIEEALNESPDVLIDFTSPSATMINLQYAAEKGVGAVVGTTGFSREEQRRIQDLSRRIPCVVSPNMSTGVNLLFRIVNEVARVLGDEYDVEIVEAHHRHKKDAPSGTALKIANVIAEALGRDLDKVGKYGRFGIIGERDRKEIGINAIRAGDIVGDHTVLFGGPGERIEITHRAHSRECFARGAVRAAKWIVDKGPGLYDMMDVLGLK